MDTRGHNYVPHNTCDDIQLKRDVFLKNHINLCTHYTTNHTSSSSKFEIRLSRIGYNRLQGKTYCKFSKLGHMWLKKFSWQVLDL